VGIFDSSDEHPPSKIRRYIITSLAFVALVGLGCWYLLRFHNEKSTLHHFMDAVVAGDFQGAYKVWKPSPTYSYKAFLEDWGPDGYYGPVQSYHVENAIGRGSIVVVVVDISPFRPFPGNDDVAKQVKTKEVRFWVNVNDESISIEPE
jgi:hypothetical protein